MRIGFICLRIIQIVAGLSHGAAWRLSVHCSAAKNCSETTMRSAWGIPSSTSMSTSPGKWSLRQCLQHWSLTLEERVGYCVADAWASSSCERTEPSQVCAYSIDFYDNNIPLLHLDGETTMWITTTSEPDCCQLNQRYTTCYRYGSTTQLQRTTTYSISATNRRDGIVRYVGD